MPLTQHFFKGLDVRSNILNKEPQRALDCLNVFTDISDRLRNRGYFQNYTFGGGVIPADGEIKGINTASFRSYKDTNRAFTRYMFAFVSGQATAGTVGTPATSLGKMLRINSKPTANFADDSSSPVGEDATTNNYHEIPAQYDPRVHFSNGPFLKDRPTKGVMAEDVMYFMGNYGIWKYDGLMMSRAGLPIGGFSTPGGGATVRSYRSFLATYDFSGQWIFGDYYQSDVSNATTMTIDYDSSVGSSNDLQQSLIQGLWDASYVVADGAPTLSGSDLSVPTTDTNLTVGKYLTYYPGVARSAFAGTGTDFHVYKMRVKSVSGAAVVFDGSQIYRKDLTRSGAFERYTGWAASDFSNMNNATQAKLTTSILLVTYMSTGTSTGFQFLGVQPVRDQVTHKLLGPTYPTTYPTTRSPIDGYPFTNAFENCYDESKVKGILEADYTSPMGTEFFALAVYNNLLLALSPRGIYFSDTSIGSTIENFDPLDFFLVGTSEDGDYTGIFANEDYVVVHRERNSYYVTGNLVTGSYKSYSLDTDKFGALSQGAQLPIFAQNVFVSNKGAHILSKGGSLANLSDFVRPIFTNDLSSTFGSFPTVREDMPRVVMAHNDKYNQFMVMYDHSNGYTETLVYNYEVKEWYRWRIPQVVTQSTGKISGGADFLNNEFWITEGSSISVDGAASPDSDFTEAYWASVFRFDGSPSLEKKYTYLKLFSTNHDATAFNCSVDVQFDWESSGFTDQGTLVLPNPEVSPVQGFDLIDLLDRRSYSFQFKVSSEGYMNLDGYELNVDLVQGEIVR